MNIYIVFILITFLFLFSCTKRPLDPNESLNFKPAFIYTSNQDSVWDVYAMNNDGNKLTGTWKDNKGYNGNFSLTRKWIKNCIYKTLNCLRTTWIYSSPYTTIEPKEISYHALHYSWFARQSIHQGSPSMSLCSFQIRNRKRDWIQIQIMSTRADM